MSRTLLAAVLLAALGCGTRTTTSIPADKADPRDTMPATQRVRGAVPVLGRTLGQHDLNQLQTYISNFHAAHNRYPTKLEDLPDLARDMPTVAGAIQSGDLVLAGGKGGVLAYEKAALEDRGNVLTTSGVQNMTADELKPKLGK